MPFAGTFFYDRIFGPPVRMWQSEWDPEECRRIAYERFDFRIAVSLPLATYVIMRYFRRYTARSDWSTGRLFKHRKQDIRERWGPPPPRKYDDDGNLL